MGLLDKLWDDTLAGPQPESGLGKLRKHSSAALKAKGGEVAAVVRSSDEDRSVAAPRVTRSIMIKKPTGCPSPSNGTPPASPACSTPPLSPFFGVKEWSRVRRKSSSDAYERGVTVVGVGSTGGSAPPHEV